MRLKHHLTEEEISDQIDLSAIIKDCKPFIRQLKGAHNLLLRGTNKRNPGMLKVKPRQDRHPMSTPYTIQNLLDEYFKAKFGWAPRSSGVFVSGSLLTALFYGPVNSVWPIGNFKFVWSPVVSDLFAELSNKKWSHWLTNPDELKAIVDTYTNKNLSKAINNTVGVQGTEIMIGCKEYYMVKNEYTMTLRKHFGITMG